MKYAPIVLFFLLFMAWAQRVSKQAVSTMGTAIDIMASYTIPYVEGHRYIEAAIASRIPLLANFKHGIVFTLAEVLHRRHTSTPIKALSRRYWGQFVMGFIFAKMTDIWMTVLTMNLYVATGLPLVDWCIGIAMVPIYFMLSVPFYMCIEMYFLRVLVDGRTPKETVSYIKERLPVSLDFQAKCWILHNLFWVIILPTMFMRCGYVLYVYEDFSGMAMKSLMVFTHSRFSKYIWEDPPAAKPAPVRRLPTKNA